MSIVMELEQIKALQNGNISFVESFEQTMEALKEKTIKFWFYYDLGQTYPFQLSIKFTRNWLDQTDHTPVVELDFSTVMAKKGNFLCMGNDVLESKDRREEIIQFYFAFEQLLLEKLEDSPLAYNYQRESHVELFESFQWSSSGKAVTSSGRREVVSNLEFGSSMLWKSQEEYQTQTTVAEGSEARRYAQYFLSQNRCREMIKNFLFYVLESKKDIRITKELSYWNYNFMIRPDMLHMDTNTLSRLGYNVTYNLESDEDKLAAMIYVFDLFSSFGTVNICLDTKTVKELNDRWDSKNPFENYKTLMQEVENMGKTDEKYEEFQNRYNTFLDGLLDMHQKYRELYEQFSDDKYQRRAQKAKTLWLKLVQH